MPKPEWKPPDAEKLAAMEATALEWVSLGNEAPEGICGSRDVLWLLTELKRAKADLHTAAEQLVAVDRDKIHGTYPESLKARPLAEGEAFVQAMGFRLRVEVSFIDQAPGQIAERPHVTISGLVVDRWEDPARLFQRGLVDR